MATHQDNTVLRNAFIGAIAALLLNLLITSSLGSVGSAIVWVVAESVIMCLSAVAIYRQNGYIMPLKRLSSYFAAYTPLLLICIAGIQFIESHLLMLSILAVTVVVYAVMVEWFVLKNKVLKIILKHS